ISLPGLVEGRLGQGGRRGWRGSAQWSQQRAWCWRCCRWTITIDLGEIAILRNAVGPKIKFLDQAQMLGQMKRGLEIEHVGNTVRAGLASTVEGEGAGAGDQTGEILVQGRAHVGGTIGKRTDKVQPLEVIAARTDPLGGCGSANPLVPRI